MVSRRSLLAAAVPAFASPARTDDRADILIRGGRVMDPRSGLDRIANVAVRGDRIASVGDAAPAARETIDARGLVVAPGFVDILSTTHAEGDAFKVADGVTTVLSTHGGPVGIGRWYQDQIQRRPLVHFGTVVGHFGLRSGVGANDGKAPATPEQVARMAELAEQAHREGAIGVGFGIEYIPGTGGDEVTALARVAARHRTSVHAHIRLPHVLDPFQGINELIAAAAVTGARVQVLHIGSMAIQRVPEALASIDAARKTGIDIAADVYPYDAWMTRIQSAIFDPGWQEKYALQFGDLVWVETGERVTAESFPRLRAKGGFVACHQIREADIEAALRHPHVSVASDGFIGEGTVSHPRGAGTFARVLGVYVRQRKVIPLMTALRKMTWQPLQRLAPGAPALARKGRLAPGMDADITVFDPETIEDRATFADPKQVSRGIACVLVAGRVTLRDGRISPNLDGAGRPIWGRSRAG